MNTKEVTQKTGTKKADTSTAPKNGSQTPNEHLVKANKAMTKAWTLISQRQDKRD